MAKLRHIAIIVPDPEAAAKFFEQAFDMKRAGKARRGIYMSDGIFNVALLKKESDEEEIGVYHFGMWVDDLDAAELDQPVAVGGIEPRGLGVHDDLAQHVHPQGAIREHTLPPAPTGPHA